MRRRSTGSRLGPLLLACACLLVRSSSAELTEAFRDAPSSGSASAEAGKPVDMFASLDYDSTLDVFYERATKNPFNGPVFSVNRSGGKESEGVLKDGKEDGWWIEYYENGTKRAEGGYINGHEVGVWRYWWPNGTLKSSGLFHAGSPEGEWLSFFESGKPSSRGAYLQGLMHGEWKFYDEDNGELQILRFDMGKKLGP